MEKETRFFIYLIERYAEYHRTTADKVLKMWDKLQLTDAICQMYDTYHCEDLQNAFDDIDAWMAERRECNAAGTPHA